MQTEDDTSVSDAALSAKLEELRQARPLAGEIVNSGSHLFDLLAREEEMRVSERAALHCAALSARAAVWKWRSRVTPGL